MIRLDTEWTMYNGEFCKPAAGGMAGVGGLKHLKFVNEKSLILKGESNRADKMNFVLEDNVIVPTTINDLTVDNFVGASRLKMRIEVMTEHELTLVLLDCSTDPPKDLLRLFYRSVS